MLISLLFALALAAISALGGVVCAVLVFFGGFLIAYLFQPVLSPFFFGTWVFFALGLGAAFLTSCLKNRPNPIIGLGLGVMGAIMVVMVLGSTAVFRADDYRHLIGPMPTVTLADTVQAVRTGEHPEPNTIDQTEVILVTEAMAHKRMQMLLAEPAYQRFGSSYQLGPLLRTRLGTRLVWLAPIDFTGMTSITGSPAPGYVWVDSHDIHQAMVETSIGATPITMPYTPNAVFGHNLDRMVWSAFPTLGTEGAMFEVDDHQRPMFVYPVIHHAVWFGGSVLDGAILADPQSGSMAYHPLHAMPSWVSRLVPESMAVEQTQDWGTYVHGWVNAVLGSGRDVKEAADSAELVPLVGGDAAYYIGVHSKTFTTGNEGFVLVNARTAQAMRLVVSGTTETMGEHAIAGVISNQRNWQTSPALLYRVFGRLTFLSVITDANDNFKGVGLVAVDNTAAVAFGPTLGAALMQYGQALQATGSAAELAEGGHMMHLAGLILRIQPEVNQGETTYWLLLQPHVSTGGTAVPVVLSATPQIGPQVALTRPGDSVVLDAIRSSNGPMLVQAFQNPAIILP